ncbi:MAG: UDP-4-amino-4,6-dideoxy-N-acetyl-beta-L-altrosamine transaminase [Alphaproteobacteria bacterium]|jgi:UDP-4-amino-4,6-dideoxy-N-acetyl-beta-L-altrosamine transaminase
MISYGKHSVSTQDIDAVKDVLENHFLTQGSKVPEFEKVLCEYTGAAYCNAVNSGTSGLHVACLAVGVGKEDIVWTSPNSFAASANCALYCGASVDFVDINPVSRNMCLVLLEQKILQARKTDSLPKAIVVVHFAGSSCDMQTIHDLCKPLNIAIIEDAAHGLGGTYKSKPIGSCEYSDIAVLSFHPVKSITTAEGGALTTNNAGIAQRCKLFANHGITKDQEQMQGDIHGNWYYQQLCLGYNYRMSDLHAALGISQLKRVDEFIASRRKLAARYFDKLSNIATNLQIKLPTDKDLNESSWHLFMIELTTQNRKEVYDKLHELGIGVNVHYIPIHLHPYYQQLGFSKGQFPNAEDFYNNALTIPLYVDLSDEQQDRVIETLSEVLSRV